MKKSKTIFVLFTSIIFLILGFSQDLNAQTSVAFKIRNLGFNVDGYFSEINIESNLLSEDVSQWRLSGNVKVSSINTDNEKRDEHLLTDDYFDVKTYPEITLEATNFKKTSDNTYDVKFNLTIKKTTKSITIPMMIKNEDELKLTCYFEIDRLDFGVGESSFVMSDTVKINISHTEKKQ